ncbi:MAG: class I SAM-dependent methyltransferase [Bacteroidota bacterium]|nr:class I SAM-dependent methyltransferase [Bacteroidota bacterium]
MNIQLSSSSNWQDYELIDSGGSEKLERFGKHILCRPEPQAVWKKSLPESEWEKLYSAKYIRMKGIETNRPDAQEKGEWKKKRGMPDQWYLDYRYNKMHLKFRLGLTSFGHIGIFPEQAPNWDYIFDLIQENPIKKGFRVLNLFAYTGGASLAASAAGAEVIHVDSVRPVITWARENMEASGLKDIHWVVEDALKFVRREAKRGNHYHGIILDPPAYGRGPDGEKWVLQDAIQEMMDNCSQLLEPGGFVLFSLYSMGFSSLIAENLVNVSFRNIGQIESGELFFTDRGKRKLPLGTFLRGKAEN